MQRDRLRERERLERFDRSRADDDDRNEAIVADDRIDSIPEETIDESTVNTSGGVPDWLQGMRPIEWKPGDLCRKTKTARGRNCCLFAPLESCTEGQYTMNGFCSYHLQAVFNVVYLMDASYRVVDGQAAIVPTPHCFVADPQPIDDRITSVFPIFELFEDKPRIEDLKLHHLANFLRARCSTGWEKAYTRHVRFLYNLITLRHQRPASQEEYDLNSMLNVHWSLWNEHQSFLLAKYPAKLHIFYAASNDNVQSASIAEFTTITQMICRLFALPYSNNEQTSFFPTIANYGFHVKRHLSFLNNLCSSGTTTTKNGMSTHGTVAILQCVRSDKNRQSLFHFATISRCNAHRVITRIDSGSNALEKEECGRVAI